MGTARFRVNVFEHGWVNKKEGRQVKTMNGMTAKKMIPQAGATW